MVSYHPSPLILVAGWALGVAGRGSTCPGTIDVAGGVGRVSLVSARWNTPGDPAGAVEVVDGRTVVPQLKGRAYFAEACTEGRYDHGDYMALKLLGKTLRYTVDLSGAGCGCNAALYLAPLRHNDQPSGCGDYYCDANNVCGESCAEIDIQEANTASWHSTLHTMTDHNGVGGGYGGGSAWNGPRDWSSSQYGPRAACIDTVAPIKVAASFPVDGRGALTAMRLTLSQDGHSCTLSLDLGSYTGMGELSRALAAGVTPVVSYWSGDMLWMDGKGRDRRGPCAHDRPGSCGDSVSFYGFSVEDAAGPGPPAAGGDGAGGRGGPTNTSGGGFCCFVGSCHDCGAKARLGSMCGASRSKCVACTERASWCTPGDQHIGAILGSADFSPRLGGEASASNQHLLAGGAALLATAFFAVTAASTAALLRCRRRPQPLPRHESPHRQHPTSATPVLGTGDPA